MNYSQTSFVPRRGATIFNKRVVHILKCSLERIASGKLLANNATRCTDPRNKHVLLFLVHVYMVLRASPWLHVNWFTVRPFIMPRHVTSTSEYVYLSRLCRSDKALDASRRAHTHRVHCTASRWHRANLLGSSTNFHAPLMMDRHSPYRLTYKLSFQDTSI